MKGTLFGGSSILGAFVGGELTRKGSVMVYPYRNVGAVHQAVFRELKVMADLGYKTALRLTDFTCEREVGLSMRDSNVVICTIGSRHFYDSEEEFRIANVEIPKTIAKCVADNPNVKRFIYVSAAGADPNSPSHRLRTKWAGENAVKKIYPDVTVIRPTVMQQHIEPNDTFTGKWGAMMKTFNRTFFQVEGANGLIQPVYTGDVCEAILNCLKMDESIGQTYELGGPHVYTYNEIYE